MSRFGWPTACARTRRRGNGYHAGRDRDGLAEIHHDAQPGVLEDALRVAKVAADRGHVLVRGQQRPRVIDHNGLRSWHKTSPDVDVPRVGLRRGPAEPDGRRAGACGTAVRGRLPSRPGGRGAGGSGGCALLVVLTWGSRSLATGDRRRAALGLGGPAGVRHLDAPGSPVRLRAGKESAPRRRAGPLPG